ncbi:hypothetical protein [Puniceibacterium sp. IMCC21224]|uniref:hypothetical protein n=1 Tax=Puniceibacterium sp. IMCC21224 TaxID=1618204 RepID=UPI0012E04319|nr:hypothetical protein [Puniceibacterium sp. IMCC21224]
MISLKHWGLAACLVAGAASGASAGAWPRGEGKSFLSLSLQSHVAGTGQGNFLSLFYERGLSPDLTLGLDAGHELTWGTYTTPIVFLRKSFARSDGSSVFAAELGLGVTDLGNGSLTTIRPGLSWGRGVSSRLGQGWIGIEATYAHRSDGSALGKIDTTFGLNLENGSLASLQFQYSAPSDGDQSLAIAPSYVMKVNDQVFIEMGGSYEMISGRKTIKLGAWFSY